MKLKATRSAFVQKLLVVGVFLIISRPVVAASDESVSTSEKIIQEKPIVIHTQAQQYDQPTLLEYQQCHENRDRCLTVCESVDNKEACVTECPTCPILINQAVLVQGINDTDYRAPAATPLNTTTVIRLTNEIRNIIDNNLGNITARNENNIHIHQNISSSGGKFGLGYNNNGSCCFVVRSSRNCDAQQFSTAERCHHKRHRVCGERCMARVMYARRVTHCAADDKTDCHQTVEYVPYRKKRASAAKCRYTQQWPFVACNRRRRQNPAASHCRKCFQLPYGLILQQGIPPSCSRCYQVYSQSYAPPWYAPPAYYPGAQHPDENVDWDEEFLPPRGGWTVEKTKCRRPDGTIIENCHQNERNDHDNDLGSGDDTEESPRIEDPLENLPPAQDEIEGNFNNYDDDDYDYENDLPIVDAPRYRRHTFRRSAYSRRNKQRI